MMLPFYQIILVSVVAGFVGSMSGMGGGVVLIPVLTFLGLPIKKVIAISIVSVIATSSGSAAAYVRHHFTNLKVGMFLEMFTILGALIGASAIMAISQRWLFLMFGIVLMVSWAVLFVRHKENWRPQVHQDKFSRWLELHGRYHDQPHNEIVEYRATRAAAGASLMFGAGFIAGLLGIGAGALKVLIHDLMMGLPPKVSTTTSNLIIGVTALAGTSVFLANGLIDPGLAAPVIVGILGGSFLGTRLLVQMHNQTVRRFFLLVLAVLGVEMIWRGIRGV